MKKKMVRWVNLKFRPIRYSEFSLSALSSRTDTLPHAEGQTIIVVAHPGSFLPAGKCFSRRRCESREPPDVPPGWFSVFASERNITAG